VNQRWTWAGLGRPYEITPAGEWWLNPDGTRELLDGTILPALPPKHLSGNEMVCTGVDQERGIITFTSRLDK